MKGISSRCLTPLARNTAVLKGARSISVWDNHDGWPTPWYFYYEELRYQRLSRLRCQSVAAHVAITKDGSNTEVLYHEVNEACKSSCEQLLQLWARDTEVYES